MRALAKNFRYNDGWKEDACSDLSESIGLGNTRAIESFSQLCN